MISDSSNPYLEIADQWIPQAFRPATRRQHDYVVRLYVGLAMKLRLRWERPCETLVKSFVVFLAKNYRTNKIVRSMCSTLRACLQRAGIDVEKFQSVKVSLLMRSLDINMRQPTRQRPPIDTDILRRIIQYWETSETVSQVLIAAVLMMFVTGMRQSNLFPTSQRAFHPTRQLVWADLYWRDTYFKLLVKWGKAQQKTATRFQKIPIANDRRMCLYSALRRVYNARPKNPKAPMFAFANGKSMPISFVNKRWKSALQALAIDQYGFTLHSLRRGGARYLQEMGVEVGTIARHVGWRSGAVYDYVNQPSQKPTMRALQKLR